MHVRELVELAASVATHVESVLAGPNGLSDEGLDAYWSTSKKRIDDWKVAMEVSNKRPTTVGRVSLPHADDMLRLAEEVLVSEILTRVWAAVLTGAKHLPSYQSAAAIGRSVFISHQEIRLRVLKWMVDGPMAGSPQIEALNLLRRRCERWTDLLLGRITLAADATPFSFDRERLAEYRRDLLEENRAGTLATSWPALLASLDGTLRGSIDGQPVSAEANANLAAALLACLGPEAVDDWGVLRWSWLHRVERTVTDAERWIAELMEVEG